MKLKDLHFKNPNGSYLVRFPSGNGLSIIEKLPESFEVRPTINDSSFKIYSWGGKEYKEGITREQVDSILWHAEHMSPDEYMKFLSGTR
jgi:hypothetical protein